MTCAPERTRTSITYHRRVGTIHYATGACKTSEFYLGTKNATSKETYRGYVSRSGYALVFGSFMCLFTVLP